MEKGEGEVSGSIMVMGVLVITLLTVGIGISMFGNVDTPGLTISNLSGDGLENDLANLADQCWRRSGKGSEIKRIDCFRPTVNTEREIDSETVASRLEEVPQSRFKISNSLDFSSTEELRISYLPKTRSINVSRMR